MSPARLSALDAGHLVKISEEDLAWLRPDVPALTAAAAATAGGRALHTADLQRGQ